ncbi:MAG: gephyrin-like molybdotransferase Glp [Rhizobiaceae bacterium]
MALLPVADALARLLDGAGPRGAENVPIPQAADRVLAEPIRALRTQPPFDASAMDGYAVRWKDAAALPARLRVVGTSAAGHGFRGTLGEGETVRIFTGAPLPAGADSIVIQEDARVLADGLVEIAEAAQRARHVRKAGLDFRDGDLLLEAGRVLDPAALSLAAAANHASLPVHRRPLVAIIATGDELLAPGSVVGPDQIIASNGYGVAAIAAGCGARVLDLGIVPDRVDAIEAAVERAAAAGADLLVTLGGASVGDHDLVQQALAARGMSLDFWRIAMRPGKPLMFGRLGDMRCLGLPGNPVSSLVCSHLFVKPLVSALAGRPFEADMRDAVLGAAMGANDTRQDYVRARVARDGERLLATPFPTQDSSMLTTLAEANGLIVRAPFAPAVDAGAPCRVLMLR